MEKIKSFCVDHNKLEPGVYISRIDDDITTYDIRFIKPNTPPYLSNEVLHSFEHLFATVARNSKYSKNVIYFGPMGCRTGFYLLLRNLDQNTSLELIKNTVKEISHFAGSLPGNKQQECGNYKEHDLQGAKLAAQSFYEKVKNKTIKDLFYQS